MVSREGDRVGMTGKEVQRQEGSYILETAVWRLTAVSKLIFFAGWANEQHRMGGAMQHGMRNASHDKPGKG